MEHCDEFAEAQQAGSTQDRRGTPEHRQAGKRWANRELSAKAIMTCIERIHGRADRPSLRQSGPDKRYAETKRLCSFGDEQTEVEERPVTGGAYDRSGRRAARHATHYR